MNERNDVNREYVSMYVPDKAGLAELLSLAKGNGTMADFAKKCGVSATTFSRIMNQNIAKPLTKELISVIAQNAADSSGVDYEALMRANGMIPKDEMRRDSVDSEKWEKSQKKREELETSIWTIIVERLYESGYMLRLFKEAEDENTKYGLVTNCDYSVRLQGYEPPVWNFRVDYYKTQGDLSNEREKESLKYRFMRKHAALFLRDVWEKETLADSMNSFVFIDPALYELFCDMLKDVQVNSWMSVILIDASKRKIIKEQPIKRRDGREVPLHLLREW